MQQNLFNTGPPVIDMYQFEENALIDGFHYIAGIDEAGRGPLAGPVVAASVILDFNQRIVGLNDSKKLTPAKRDALYELIKKQAISIGIGSASPELIDEINILQATRRAMLDAVRNLQIKPDILLIDGITPIESSLQQRTIKQGDARSASIAAASIVAKVTRDRLMMEYDKQYPHYGFARHKGYGSALHLAALSEHGPCPIHRKTFAGVKEFFQY